MKQNQPDGATDFHPLDFEGLKVTINSPKELNEVEAANIVRATQWAYASKSLRKELLTAPGLMKLHKRMFGDVWDWAGTIRKRELNIGVRPSQILNELDQHLGNTRYHLEHHIYGLDETAIRFHHQLTRIHPFTNGNGRLARLATNLLLKFQGGTKFTWGKGNLADESPDRSRYIEALKEADKSGDVAELLKFARL